MSPGRLPDQSSRDRVWQTERSVVVDASAGTGKTWLLVQRALWFVLKRGVPMRRMVMLTFTEKAAREMGTRLRVALQRVVAAPARDGLPEEAAPLAGDESLAALQGRARTALDDFQHAHISTIHSFAADVLRLFSAEAGVDPTFAVDEGPRFAGLVDDEWDTFLSRELGPEASPARRKDWLALLERVKLEDIEDLAKGLASFRVNLDGLPDPARPAAGEVPEPVRHWLEKIIAACAEMARGGSGPDGGGEVPGFVSALRDAARSFLDSRKAPGAVIGQLLEEAEEFRRPEKWEGFSTGAAERGAWLARQASALRHVPGEGLVFAALALLAPFARSARSVLLVRGYVPFDGLLSLARDLLRDRPEVRRALKARFDAVLVDEAQDVDPLQLEMILYLAEETGGSARDWRKVRLEPGKLFLVGDPKQLIYGWREADMGAYGKVAELAEKSGAERLVLSASMRSHEAIIGFVNAAGPALFSAGSSVPYQPLEPGPPRAGRHPHPRVVVRRAGAHEGEKSEEADARAAAEWIRAAVERGTPPGQIAVIARKAGWMSAQAEALRAEGVPVTIEEERRFFLRTETADLHNILALLADPADTVALAGALRGPWGGLDDDQLIRWFAAWSAGPERTFARMEALAGTKGLPPTLPALVRTLAALSRNLQSVPGRVAVERLWRALSVDALAAESGRTGAREAVARLKRMLGDLLESRGVSGTLDALAQGRESERAFELGPDRAPRLPAPAGTDAVRLMTIHQAKGLEFPVVVLAGGAQRDAPDSPAKTAHLEDWTAGLAGAAIKAKGSKDAILTLEGAWIAAEKAEKGREEERRILYVALTRARDVLVVIRPYDKDGGPEKAPFTEPIAGMLEGPGALAAQEERPSGEPVAREAPAEAPVKATAGRGAPVEAFPEVVSPSDLLERFADDLEEFIEPGTRPEALMTGEVCHRVLEHWEFGTPAEGLGAEVDRAIAAMAGSAPPPPLVRERAMRLLSGFLASAAARTLAGVEMAGREVSLLVSAGERVISARADIVYRLGGKLFVGDYKMGSGPAVSPAVAGAYRDAATAALGEPVSFALISLADGTIITA